MSKATKKQLFHSFNLKQIEKVETLNMEYTRDKFITWTKWILFCLITFATVYFFVLKITNCNIGIAYQIYGYMFGLLFGELVYLFPIAIVSFLILLILKHKLKRYVTSTFSKPFKIPFISFYKTLSWSFILGFTIVVLILKIVLLHQNFTGNWFDFQNVKSMFLTSWYGKFLLEKQLIYGHLGFIVDNVLNILVLISMSPILLYLVILILVFIIYYINFIKTKKLDFLGKSIKKLDFSNLSNMIRLGKTQFVVTDSTQEFFNFLFWYSRRNNFNINQMNYFEVLNNLLSRLKDGNELNYQINKFKNKDNRNYTMNNPEKNKDKPKPEAQLSWDDKFDLWDDAYQKAQAKQNSKYVLENSKNIEGHPSISFEKKDIKTKFNQQPKEEKPESED
ncbi:hypothetical protein [Mycoplasma hafezii]|uniref:hypothetical protein n=1 Tax=Mycoplasma hafezii TaxID=525886 RepID=UPI003CF59A7A